MKDLIRTLRADEIECRVQSVSKDSSGCILLLYKDARCDQRILDEIFGLFNWQRRHYECKGNLFCEVGIKDPSTGEWVFKGDCGSESNTDKEKGEASDSFKRACFNWGIGRELYTSPFIYVKLNEGEVTNGKLSQRLKFHVSEIAYNESKEITKLRISDNNGTTRYTFGCRASDSVSPIDEARKEMTSCKTMEEAVAVWKKYTQFQSDPNFQRDKERVKARITTQQ